MPPLRSELEESKGWRVAKLRDGEAFFRAVGKLLPEATHVFLEGTPDPDVVEIISSHAEAVEYRAPIGTLWSWPRGNRRFSLRASQALFDHLADVAAHHAEPELCCHVHFYREAEPLAHWFDAFADPFIVSSSIPRDRVEEFCRKAGGTLAKTGPT